MLERFLTAFYSNSLLEPLLFDDDVSDVVKGLMKSCVKLDVVENADTSCS